MPEILIALLPWALIIFGTYSAFKAGRLFIGSHSIEMEVVGIEEDWDSDGDQMKKSRFRYTNPDGLVLYSVAKVSTSWQLHDIGAKIPGRYNPRSHQVSSEADLFMTCFGGATAAFIGIVILIAS